MMAKGKDPAFLFYPNDFILGTYTMTNEQVGMYIRALSVAHTKNGKLTEKEIRHITNDDEVLSKFSIDDDGFYYNKRLLEEITFRKLKSEKNRENGGKGGNPNFEKGKPNPYYNQEDNQTVMLKDNQEDKQKINITLENEDIDISEDINISNSFIKSIKIIVDYLNQVLGTQYKYTSRKTQELIKARFNDGFTMEDFQRVIDIKYEEWHNDEKMGKFLRPETLFSNKFESYLNQKQDVKKQISKYVTEQYKKTGDLW